MNSKTIANKMHPIENRYENTIASDKIIMIRVDGRSFHSFYKRNFHGHFSRDMQHFMNEAMKYTMTQIPDITFGFTNSDEITFLLMPNKNAETSFNGRVAKFNSIIASLVTAKFNQLLEHDDLASFDARTFEVTHDEMVDMLHWRQESCLKNTINTYAREFFQNHEMKNRNPLQLQEDLAKAGIDPVAHDGFYWGYFIARASGLDYKIAKGSITEIADVYLTPAKQ